DAFAHAHRDPPWRGRFRRRREEGKGCRRERGDYSSTRCHTTEPPTIVAAGAPVSSQPVKGVYLPFDRNRGGSPFTRVSGSKSVTSAGDPTASVPPGSPKTFAGPAENSAANRASESLPRRTSRSWTTEAAVSRPTTPNGAESKSTAFSSSW